MEITVLLVPNINKFTSDERAFLIGAFRTMYTVKGISSKVVLFSSGKDHAAGLMVTFREFTVPEHIDVAMSLIGQDNLLFVRHDADVDTNGATVYTRKLGTMPDEVGHISYIL